MTEPTKPQPPSKQQAGTAPAPVPTGDEPVVLPEPVEAVLRQVPATQQAQLRETFAAFMQFQGPAPNPLMRKITADHVTKMIDGAEKDNERHYTDRREGRGHSKFLIVVCGIFILAMSGLFLWASQAQLLDKLLQFGIVFIGGVGTGVGLSKRRK